jgi:hypothetical protein
MKHCRTCAKAGVGTSCDWSWAFATTWEWTGGRFVLFLGAMYFGTSSVTSPLSKLETPRWDAQSTAAAAQVHGLGTWVLVRYNTLIPRLSSRESVLEFVAFPALRATCICPPPAPLRIARITRITRTPSSDQQYRSRCFLPCHTRYRPPSLRHLCLPPT